MIPQFGHHTQNQGLPVQPGNPRLVRNAMSMNFIPLSDPSKQTPTLTRNPITGEMMNPQSIGAPLTQLPQFGSMNNLTMPKTPTYGQTPVPIHDMSQYAQPIQKRPQLNARFLSQPELPLMGMNRSPVNQQGIPGIDPLMMNRDPNMLSNIKEYKTITFYSDESRRYSTTTGGGWNGL